MLCQDSLQRSIVEDVLVAGISLPNVILQSQFDYVCGFISKRVKNDKYVEVTQ